MYARIGASVALALVLSLGATPVVKWLAKLVGAIDVPKEARRIHKSPIPLLGGLAIFIGFIVSVLLFADITLQIRGILIGAVILVIIGAIDDIHPLRAYIKLIVQIVAALVAIYHGIEIEIFSNPFVLSAKEYVSLGVFTIPVTVIWIVGITNSVNFIDGLDGLAVGVSTISSAVMLIIALMVSDLNVAVIMAALAGACIGFIPYNFNPAKIFMGDTGALLLGYVLATVSILGLFKFYAVVSFAVPFLVLALPLFDTSFAFFRRILKGKNPMLPDRGHFHHRLLDMGLNQKQAVTILYTISGLLGLAAVLTTMNDEMRTLIFIVAVLVAAGIAFFAFRGIRKGAPAANGRTAAPPDDPIVSPDDPAALFEARPAPDDTAALPDTQPGPDSPMTGSDKTPGDDDEH